MNRGFCIGEGYMINEFNDNIQKIYVNSAGLVLFISVGPQAVSCFMSS